MDYCLANHGFTPCRPHRRLLKLLVILVQNRYAFRNYSAPEARGELDLVGAGGSVVEQIGAFAGREATRHFFVRIPQNFVRQ